MSVECGLDTSDEIRTNAHACCSTQGLLGYAISAAIMALYRKRCCPKGVGRFANLSRAHDLPACLPAPCDGRFERSEPSSTIPGIVREFRKSGIISTRKRKMKTHFKAFTGTSLPSHSVIVRTTFLPNQIRQSGILRFSYAAQCTYSSQETICACG